MTIREIYDAYLSSLKEIYSSGEAAAITDIIFRHFANLTRSEIITKGNVLPDEATAAHLRDALERLKQHIPVQYITGEAWFHNLKFLVNEHVLIPRPETEELVQAAINFLKIHTGKKVLEIGTGSGCIAISIKKNIPDAQIISVDVSTDAIKTAKANAVLNNVSVEFREINFLKKEDYNTLGNFDLIISNPPYIPAYEKKGLDKNVALYEPAIALFVPDKDPLIFYRYILSFANDHMSVGGVIFLEIHENLSKETQALFSGENYSAEIKRDIFGKERMLVCSKKIEG